MATETYYAMPAGSFTGDKIGNFRIVDGVGNTVLLQRVVECDADGTPAADRVDGRLARRQQELQLCEAADFGALALCRRSRDRPALGDRRGRYERGNAR